MRKQETDMWPDDYYREMDGKNRKKLLDEALGSGSEETADEDRLRLKLWQARYAPEEQDRTGRKKNKEAGEIDYFIKAWLDLSLISKKDSAFGKNRMKRVAREAAGTLLLDQYSPDKFGSLLDQEYVHLFHLLMDLYLHDGGFTHRVLGFTKLNADELQKKIADRFVNVTRDMPARCGLTELFAPLYRAAAEAFGARFKGASFS